MCPRIFVMRKSKAKSPSAGERGFVIVSAIFLLLVLGMLGTFIVTLSNVQSTTSATDVDGVRAQWAARSGLDWASYQVLVNSGAYACATGCVPGSCIVPANATATNNLTMGSYVVTVSCSCTSSCQNGATVRAFRFVSSACNQENAGACPNAVTKSPTYVSRELSSTMVISP
jgi:MSHA biogenesis protein MshP